jgi:hypothetical protein
MKRYYLPILLLVLLLWAPSVFAQCQNGTIPGCQPAKDVQPTDILLLYQFGQSPHSRKVSVGDLANTTAGTFTNLAVTGSATIGGSLTAGASTLSSLNVPGAVSFTGPGPTSFTVTGGASIGGALSAFSANFGTLVGGSTSLSSLSTSGNASVGGTLGVTGITTFSSPYVPESVTIAGLPANPGAGGHVWATNCQNGSENAGNATGCYYHTNDVGTWVPEPSPPTGTITIGSATPVHLGGSFTGSGNGSNVQMTTAASKVNGNCVQWDATGNTVDSGTGCGGGGGSGTVSAGLPNQIAAYAAAGNTVSGLTIVNNSVPSYNGSGLLSNSTTLPGSLTIPSPSISNPTVTGTLSAITVNLSGKLTFAAGAVGGASANIPAGVAPTSPNNGDIWTTSTGLFVRAGGVTIGPVIGLAQQSALAPLVYNSGTGQESCPTCALTVNGGLMSAQVPVALSAAGLISCTTCATTTNGGGLTAIAPMSISAAGSIALASTQRYAEFVWDSQASVHNDTYPVAIKMPSTGGGTIQSITYYTNGTTSPAFTISLQIAGTPVTSCNAIVVGTGGNGVGTTTTTTCTAANTFTANQRVDLVITGTFGSPSSAAVQVNYLMAPT